MVKSMTGFGHRDFSRAGLQGSLEIRSWNNRYLDVSVSLPSWLSVLEPKIRDFLSARIVHGKVECSLRARSVDIPVRAVVDLEAGKAVASMLRELSRAAGLDEGPRLSDIASVEGILGFERIVDPEELWTFLLGELEGVFAAFEDSRILEGRVLERDILTSLDRVDRGRSLVESQVPAIEATLRRNVSERFREILGEGADEGRILAEVASLLMKYTINEEVVRLGAHCSSFRRILAGEGAQAKKLDFLCQEMNREVNTIGSKSMILAVTETVVELKDALENIREQLKNLE